MSEPRYFQLRKSPEDSQRIIDDALESGKISGDEYELVMRGPDEMTNREIEQALEILARIGVYGKIITD